MKKTKVIFLGTNGWYDTQIGNTICTLILSPHYSLVLDAGYGIYKLIDYVNQRQPVYLFLSHPHLDHVVGLHALNRLRFQNTLYILGSKLIKKSLSTLVNPPFTLPFNKLHYPVKFIELPRQNKTLPFPIKVLPMRHSCLTLGVRLQVDNKIIAYCPDTGYCQNAITLAQKADLFITECAFKSGQKINKAWPHLNPKLAAKMAQEAQAKLLYLTHFDANVYPTLLERKKAAEEARKIFKASFTAKDDLAVEI